MTPREKKRIKKKELNQNIKQESKKEEITYTNYLLTIAYDGTNFGGYAKQKFPNTIEEKLNTAIDKYLDEHIRLISSSRTDAKVHAMDQKVMFKCSKTINKEKFLNYTKENLPKSIKINDLVKVPKNFHCRYDVIDKTYIYKVNTIEDIFLQNYSYFWNNQNLNIKKINDICNIFSGTHDFIGFCNPKKDSTDTTRTINYFTFIKESDNKYYFKINGNGFLYNMIRIMVAAIIYWYENDYSLNEIKNFLLSTEKFTSNGKAPAQGLYLMEINYDK